MADAGPHPLVASVTARLSQDLAGPAALQAALEDVLAHFQAVVGTIHLLDPATNLLQMAAQQGVPDGLRPKVQTIPIGKGMGGLAAQRREPVQVCNLQTDASGVAKPSAKETGVEGSIAVPMLVDDELRGVLGIARPVECTYGAEEIALLMEVASVMGRKGERPL